MLEFFIPILYPEKPTRVTVTVGNTIIGALLGERKVDWGILLQSVVAKLVDGVQKFKAMPIELYLFHLYMGQELLNREEMVAYKINLDLLKYDCTPDPDPDQGQTLKQGQTRHEALLPSTTNGRRKIDPDLPRIAETGTRGRISPSRN